VGEWSFQRKLITGVILICLLAIMTTGVRLFTSRYLIANIAQVGADEGVDLDAARQLELLGIRNIADVRALLLSANRDDSTAVFAGSLRIRENIARLKQRMRDPEDQALLDRVAFAEQSYRQAFRRALAGVGTSGTVEARQRLVEPLFRQGAEFDRALAALVGHMQLARTNGLTPGRAAVRRADDMLFWVSISSLGLLVFVCFVLFFGLNRSFQIQQSELNRAERGQQKARASLSEVEAASHLKDEFLATVSHELRNPLAPILTWTQLLRSGTLDHERTQRALEVIERNVMSQVQLIDDLVDVSRVVSGKFRLEVRPIELAPVIKMAADAQSPASQAKQIQMQLRLEEHAGQISGDPDRLQQVMWNLISNAIKFTPEGGSVQVVLERVESHVEVRVSDNGCGIEPEFMPHIFEPFRQGTGGSMRRHAGLGLGLSIARHIVELHGGEIHAASAGAGCGAQFTLRFPLLAKAPTFNGTSPRPQILGDDSPPVHLGRLDGLRVLLVEDEPSASESLQALFHSCGAEARIASSVPEAMAIFEVWQPNVLVSDIAMPGEDGYSLIRRIRLRTAAQGGTIPAVALTAYAKIEDRVTILSAGFQMYLAKPADPNELIAVVGSLARHRVPGVPQVG